MPRPIILIGGRSDTGKSASLRNINNPDKVLYLNFEPKDLPFIAPFREQKISDPYTLHKLAASLIEKGEAGKEKFETLVIDSITACMAMFTIKYIGKDCPDTRAAWGEYGNFYEHFAKTQMHQIPQNIIVIAHIDYVEEPGGLDGFFQAVVQGRVGKVGIEADFGLVVNTAIVPVSKLKEEKFKNDLLHITEEDEIEGFKYVLQVRKTLDTKDTKIRSPIGMWKANETYIDPNVQLILDRFNTFYNQ
jgi:hypothetical protein